MSLELPIPGSAPQATESACFALPRKAELPGLARRGLSWSFLLQAGKYVISLGSTGVLARMLSPSDYGLVAMVATFTVLVQAFSDFGLSWATVQRENLTRSQIDSLFLINSGFGLLLVGVCWLAAPAVAAFYGRPELMRITQAASVALFLSSIAVQPIALMRRQMRLKQLALCGLWSVLVAAIAAIVAARLGLGYWALIVQLLCQQAAFALLSFPMSGYLPGIPRRPVSLGSILAFGGYAASYGLINYCARNLDNVLVGRFWGATDLGFYSRAYFLMTLPGMLAIGMFGGVVIPALSALKKEPAAMETSYLKALRLITVITAPFAAFLAAAAPELVEFVYGPKWQAVVPILLWLAAASILQPVQNTACWLYIVAGQGRGLFFMGLQVACAAGIGFAAGLSYGPVGVACGYAVMNTVVAYPTLLQAHRAAGLNMKRTVASTVPLLVSALIMALAVWLCGMAVSMFGLGMHLRLAIKVVVGSAVYIVCVRMLARETYTELEREVRGRWPSSERL